MTNGECEVYVGLSADVLHHGHVRLLESAANLGPVTVGLLTDSALRDHKQIPALRWSERKEILLALRTVDRVVPQEEWSYAPNVLRLRPRYFVHGDDWRGGLDSELRREVVAALEFTGGSLVEVTATSGVATDSLRKSYRSLSANPGIRLGGLKRLVQANGFCRVIEVHSPLAAIIAENTSATFRESERGFDAFWSSSLTDSALLGKPDNELLTLPERLKTLDQILAVSSRPVVVDAETGGHVQHLSSHCRSMIRMGVSAVVVEDKMGLKQNSLLGESRLQQQVPAEQFGEKLAEARSAIDNIEFMLIARIESLILGTGLDDAVRRAVVYAESGADGLLIHSRRPEADEVVACAERVRRAGVDLPLICVPTSYFRTPEDVLRSAGFQVVVYANHSLRASARAMGEAMKSILQNGKAEEAELKMMPVAELLEMFGGQTV